MSLSRNAALLVLVSGSIVALAGCSHFPGPLAHMRAKREAKKAANAATDAVVHANTPNTNSLASGDFYANSDAPVSGHTYAAAGDVYIDATALTNELNAEPQEYWQQPRSGSYYSTDQNTATQSTTSEGMSLVDAALAAEADTYNATHTPTGYTTPTPATTTSTTHADGSTTVSSFTFQNTPQQTGTMQPFASTDPLPPAQPTGYEPTQPVHPGSGSIYEQVLDAELPTEADESLQQETTANVRQVTFAEAGADFDPQVSRDGKFVIYASTQHRKTADIYIKTIDGRVVTRLTSDPAQDVMPSLSPDGQYLAYTSNRSGSWDLYLMPAAGGKALQLTDETTHDLHPSWSPDGRMIVFSRLGQTSGRWELWVLDVAHPSSVQFIGYGLFPEWSPVAATGFDGADRILFQRSRQRGSRAFGVWTIDYDPDQSTAGRETEIASSVEFAYINPSWSPDAEFIIYASVSKEDNDATGSSLWMVGHEGNGRVKLIGGASSDIMPVWGADGRVIFVSDRSGHENLWSLPIDQAVSTANAQRPHTWDKQNNNQPAFATVPTDAAPAGEQ